jgi:hypothetical protein
MRERRTIDLRSDDLRDAREDDAHEILRKDNLMPWATYLPEQDRCENMAGAKPASHDLLRITSP